MNQSSKADSLDEQVTFHPSNPSKSSEVARLIYQSSHELLDYMFSNKNTAERTLGKLCRKKNGHFGYSFTTIAQINNQVTGIELGYDKTQLQKQELIGGLMLLLSSPVSKWWHIATKVGKTINGYVPKPSEDSYYINNIAIFPESRGRGMGTLLLTETINRSKKSGYQKVELDVTTVNLRAIKFYQSHGFTQESESGDQALMDKHGLPPLVRMVKPL